MTQPLPRCYDLAFTDPTVLDPDPADWHDMYIPTPLHVISTTTRAELTRRLDEKTHDLGMAQDTIAELRDELAARPVPLDRVEVALLALTRRTPRRRPEWLTVALGSAALVYDELTAPEHRGWAIFALGVGGLFVAVVCMGGKW